MEKTLTNVSQYNHKVVSTPAKVELDNYNNNNNNNYNKAVDGCFSQTNNNNNNNNNNVNHHHHHNNNTEDDCTSCASDYESSSSVNGYSTSTTQISRNNTSSDNLNYDSTSSGNNTNHRHHKMMMNHHSDVKMIKTVKIKKGDFHYDMDLSTEVGKDVYDITEMKSIPKFIQSRIESGELNESFLITNLGAIVTQFHLWKSELPMVQPFYAVKCNPDTAVVRLLASLGCCFDCATQGEIDLVLHGLGDELSFSSRGIAHSSIVYANPAKMEGHIKYAIEHGVRMTVIDGEDELIKISKIKGNENLQLLLRLTTDDRASVCQFSRKFGCPVREAPALLRLAKSLGLNIAGVSFHVGSGCGDANAYVIALDHTRQVFEYADELGMEPMHIIDIGGGFPGDTGGYGGPGMPTFQDLAAAVRAGIDNFAIGFKRPMSSVRIIAEPGRFFASACTSVATKIYARKGGYGNNQALYVDDGVYGTFNNIIYDHATPVPLKLSTLINPKSYDESDEDNESSLLPTIVFGPTCDGLDQLCSLDKTKLPRCEVDDWLYWENMGAYTHTASFFFNGYTHVPTRCYCYVEDA